MRRLNLLPLNRRLGLRREVMLSAATKFLRGVAFGLGGLILVGALAGTGLWIMSETMSRSTEVDLQMELSNYQRLRVIVSRENAVLELVNDLAKDRLEWSLVVANLLKIVPPGVTIETMNADKATSLISLSGSALNRSSLVVFEDRLRVMPWIEEVVAPRENLMSRINPSYTIQVVVDPKNVEVISK